MVNVGWNSQKGNKTAKIQKARTTLKAILPG